MGTGVGRRKTVELPNQALHLFPGEERVSFYGSSACNCCTDTGLPVCCRSLDTIDYLLQKRTDLIGIVQVLPSCRNCPYCPGISSEVFYGKPGKTKIPGGIMDDCPVSSREPDGNRDEKLL